ncbi:hypothetical protein O181_055815 [Austropuccinia psidii MF-1]|uniref:Uncharacterized protein n=1 Tax=Austropuccinia psidii MF-1 TaxID=1389203 RepID=A0A9Q3HVL1_9BASI|nr:hypothetical protein [Austropuccinia psidii MF-1]
MVTSPHLQPVASYSRRREDCSPLPLPSTCVFQKREQWTFWVTREFPKRASESKDAVARLFRRVDRKGREVIIYANDTAIPGTASEEKAAKFSCYEDGLINDFQRTLSDFGGDE